MGDTAQMENIFRCAALAQDSFPLAQHDVGQVQHHAMIISCQRLQSLSGHCGAVNWGAARQRFPSECRRNGQQLVNGRCLI